jgi:hypothetical protein
MTFKVSKLRIYTPQTEKLKKKYALGFRRFKSCILTDQIACIVIKFPVLGRTHRGQHKRIG